MIASLVLAAISMVLLLLGVGIFSGGQGRRTDRIGARVAALGGVAGVACLEVASLANGAEWWVLPLLLGAEAVLVGLVPFGMWLGRRLHQGPR